MNLLIVIDSRRPFVIWYILTNIWSLLTLGSPWTYILYQQQREDHLMEETRPERNSQGRESGDQTDRIKLSVMTLAVIPVLQMLQMTEHTRCFCLMVLSNIYMYFQQCCYTIGWHANGRLTQRYWMPKLLSEWSGVFFMNNVFQIM